MKEARKALFLDKDGTLIEDIRYNCCPEKMRLMPNSAAGLFSAWEAGFDLIVVSNQAGVALGHFSESDLAIVESRLRELLGEIGLPLTAFYYCPHYPSGTVPQYARTCDCRKPMPGMLHRAAQDLQLNLRGSWLIGDILDDIEAGSRAGCKTVLLANGHEDEWQLTPMRVPDYVAADLDSAVTLIRAADY